MFEKIILKVRRNCDGNAGLTETVKGYVWKLLIAIWELIYINKEVFRSCVLDFPSRDSIISS